jgi:hypothetical protein
MLDRGRFWEPMILKLEYYSPAISEISHYGFLRRLFNKASRT